MNRVGNGGRHSRHHLAGSLEQQLVQVKGTLVVDKLIETSGSSSSNSSSFTQSDADALYHPLTTSLFTQTDADALYHPLTTIDAFPTQGNTNNLASSHGTAMQYSAFVTFANTTYMTNRPVDTTPTLHGHHTNLVSSNGVAIALVGKHGNLVSSNNVAIDQLVDTTPTVGNTDRLVTSDAVASAGYLTSVPSSYITEAASDAKYATAAQGALASTATQPSDLATVATSGSYNDLSNQPTIFSGAYADLSGTPTLFSGVYADLSGTPTLGTAAATASTDYATAAQGVKADSALQNVPAAYLTETQNDAKYLTPMLSIHAYMLEMQEDARMPHITLTNIYDNGTNFEPTPVNGVSISGSSDLPINNWRVFSSWTLEFANNYAQPSTTENLTYSYAQALPLYNTNPSLYKLRDYNNTLTSGQYGSLTLQGQAVKFVQITQAGFYEIHADFFFAVSNPQRINVGIQIVHKVKTGASTYNAVGRGQIGASSYMRRASGHNSASSHTRNVFWVYADDMIGVQTVQLGTIGLAMCPAGRSHLTIKKLPTIITTFLRFYHPTTSGLTGQLRCRVWKGLGPTHVRSNYINGDAGSPLIDVSLSSNATSPTESISGYRDYYVDMSSTVTTDTLGTNSFFDMRMIPGGSTTMTQMFLGNHTMSVTETSFATVLSGTVQSGLIRFKLPYPINYHDPMHLTTSEDKHIHFFHVGAA